MAKPKAIGIAVATAVCTCVAAGMAYRLLNRNPVQHDRSVVASQQSLTASSIVTQPTVQIKPQIQIAQIGGLDNGVAQDRLADRGDTDRGFDVIEPLADTPRAVAPVRSLSSQNVSVTPAGVAAGPSHGPAAAAARREIRGLVVITNGIISFDAALATVPRFVGGESKYDRVYIRSAALGYRRAGETSRRAAGWNLIDESPLPDVSQLLADDDFRYDPLAKYIESWAVAGRDEKPSPNPTMSPHQLGELASSSVLPWKGLYDVARLASYMDGPNRAQPLYRAALERAEATSKRAGKWSPVEVVALHGLASAFVLEYRDAAAAAKTLKILMAGGDDRAASVATLVHYGSLCEWLGVDRSAEAVAMLQKRLSAASDLSVSQVAELQWARGRALFAGGQYAEALNPLRIAASTNVDRPFVDQANVLFIKAMIRAGNTTAAQAEYDRMAANERTRPILVLDKDLLRELRGEMPVEPGRVTSKGKTTK